MEGPVAAAGAYTWGKRKMKHPADDGKGTEVEVNIHMKRWNRQNRFRVSASVYLTDIRHQLPLTEVCHLHSRKDIWILFMCQDQQCWQQASLSFHWFNCQCLSDSITTKDVWMMFFQVYLMQSHRFRQCLTASPTAQLLVEWTWPYPNFNDPVGQLNSVGALEVQQLWDSEVNCSRTLHPT